MIALEHVGINAENTVDLKEWYVNLFGFKTVYDNKKENRMFILLIMANAACQDYYACIKKGKVI